MKTCLTSSKYLHPLPTSTFRCVASASNATLEAEHCGMHVCQNGGACVAHVTDPGYDCACPELYGGVFCEDRLGKSLK